MTRKFTTLMLAVVVLLTACSSDEDVLEPALRLATVT